VGGAGATTLAIALAAVLMEEERRRVLLLDASPAGGDLGARMYGTIRPTSMPWEQWARTGCAIEPLASQLGPGPGLVTLPSNPPAPDAGGLLTSAIEAVTAAGWIVVIDAGSGAVGSPTLASSVTAHAALALVVPQRAGDANRARWFLSALALRFGTQAIRDAVVAVTDQGSGQPEVLQTVSNGLAGKVSTIVEVPQDPQLAAGLQLTGQFGEPVRSAARLLIGALAGTDAAGLRPAR
jgi:MinD-like ATPase involved in chromosome partitioning or flagellar assembly